MAWTIVAGSLTGMILGYLGAGSGVIGVPVFLYLAGLSPHAALGTNALGVSLIALALFVWRVLRGQVPVRAGLVFTLPGLIGIYFGARIGLIFPGEKLIFLLGFLLFIVAGWLFYLSLQGRPKQNVSRGAPDRLLTFSQIRLMVPTALIIGVAAGFFAIGGGFMIVPALALIVGMDLIDAAAAGLLPIAAFAGWIGVQYWLAGSTDFSLAVWMIPPGLAGGIVGVRLGQSIPRRISQRIFAAFLVGLGTYMILK